MNASKRTRQKVFFSYYADKYVSRWGRRKPMVVLGYAIEAISGVLLVSPPSMDPSFLIWWFVLLFKTLSAVGDLILGLSFLAWLIESTQNGDDYKRFQSLSFPIGGAERALSASAI